MWAVSRQAHPRTVPSSAFAIGASVARVVGTASNGQVASGAHTTVGADAQAPEWKYVPVPRTGLFLEESLYRGNL